MGAATAVKVEHLANEMVGYLCEHYSRNQHVRRVASWIGLLLTAIAEVAGGHMSRNRSRQVMFEYRGHRFKARFNHKAGLAGGIDILEVRPGRGMPNGAHAVSVTSLAQAAEVSSNLKEHLDRIVAG
jgi:hypothetical protein